MVVILTQKMMAFRFNIVLDNIFDINNVIPIPNNITIITAIVDKMDAPIP